MRPPTRHGSGPAGVPGRTVASRSPRPSPGLESDVTSGHPHGTLGCLMPDAARPPDLTIEEHLRAAQGVLLLIAEIFERHSLTPDGTGPGFSAAASATVARPLPAPRRRSRPAGEQPARSHGQRRGAPDPRGPAVTPRPSWTLTDGHKETRTMRPRRPRVLPFPTPAQSPPTGGSPPRRYPGLVATLSLDAKELARLVARGPRRRVGEGADRRPPASIRHGMTASMTISVQFT